MPTVRYARTRIRVARLALVRLDPWLANREVWTLYRGAVPGRRTARTTRGKAGTGR